eukprot:6244724-Pyramimonas_sp.AAC.1
MKLCRDGVTIKLRIRKEDTTAGWQLIRKEDAPPTDRYLLDKIPAGTPTEAIPKLLLETLAWVA